MIDENKCASCRFLDADFGPVPCCYQNCVDNNLYEYAGLDGIGLQVIRKYIIDNIMRNEDIMHNEDARNYVDLPSVIASLYELLHREITGESYNYMFHWANKVGSTVEDNLFGGEVK